MEEIKLDISLAFRKEGNKEDHKESLYILDVLKMNDYLKALKKEIIAGKEDNEDFLVTAIEFMNGSYSHYAINDIQELYACIEANFNVSKDACITLHTTPSSFTFYRLMLAKQLHRAEIILEIPTSDEELLKKWNYSSLKECDDACELCFNESYSNAAVLLDSEHQSIEQLRDSINHYSSRIHKFYFTKPLTEEQLKDLADIKNITADGINIMKPKSNVLGIGLNARTDIYGNKAKNTDDLDLYIAHSDDFEIITKIED